MPLDLVLVRHGESEGNLADRMSQAGDDSAWTPEFRARHSSQYRLTDRGREQALIAGAWIRANLGERFDRHLTSEYVRAMETAALLGLPGALWQAELYLRERDAGSLDSLATDEKFRRFPEAMEERERDAFYWRPPGGESLAEVCLRVDRVLDTLRRAPTPERVIIVCHGEVMRAFRVRIERIPQHRYMELHAPADIRDQFHNCLVLHYTRRDPARPERVEDHLAWMRSTCPWDPSLSRNLWQPVTRPRHTDSELLRIVERVPRLLSDPVAGEVPAVS
jgi:NAD+ kinase